MHRFDGLKYNQFFFSSFNWVLPSFIFGSCEPRSTVGDSVKRCNFSGCRKHTAYPYINYIPAEKYSPGFFFLFCNRPKNNFNYTEKCSLNGKSFAIVVYLLLYCCCFYTFSTTIIKWGSIVEAPFTGLLQLGLSWHNYEAGLCCLLQAFVMKWTTVSFWCNFNKITWLPKQQQQQPSNNKRNKTVDKMYIVLFHFRICRSFTFNDDDNKWGIKKNISNTSLLLCSTWAFGHTSGAGTARNHIHFYDVLFLIRNTCFSQWETFHILHLVPPKSNIKIFGVFLHEAQSTVLW